MANCSKPFDPLWSNFDPIYKYSKIRNHILLIFTDYWFWSILSTSSQEDYYKKSPNGGYQSAYVSNRYSVSSDFKYIIQPLNSDYFYRSLKVLGVDLEFRLLSL